MLIRTYGDVMRTFAKSSQSGGKPVPMVAAKKEGRSESWMGGGTSEVREGAKSTSLPSSLLQPLEAFHSPEDRE